MAAGQRLILRELRCEIAEPSRAIARKRKSNTHTHRP